MDAGQGFREALGVLCGQKWRHISTRDVALFLFRSLTPRHKVPHTAATLCRLRTQGIISPCDVVPANELDPTDLSRPRMAAPALLAVMVLAPRRDGAGEVVR